MYLIQQRELLKMATSSIVSAAYFKFPKSVHLYSIKSMHGMALNITKKNCEYFCLQVQECFM